jgi:hypothetical protein
VIRRPVRAFILTAALGASIVFGLAAIPIASADGCSVVASDQLTGQSFTIPGVTVPASVTGQTDLLAAPS